MSRFVRFPMQSGQRKKCSYYWLHGFHFVDYCLYQWKSMRFSKKERVYFVQEVVTQWTSLNSPHFFATILRKLVIKAYVGKGKINKKLPPLEIELGTLRLQDLSCNTLMPSWRSYLASGWIFTFTFFVQHWLMDSDDLAKINREWLYNLNLKCLSLTSKSF